MGEWNRTTRECSLDQIHPEMAAAIQKHVETHNLGPILEEALICIETVSEKVKKGIFGGGGDRRVVTCAIVTPGWLVWAVSGEKSGTAALSASLRDLQVTDYAATAGYRLLPDTGIELSGELTGRVGMHGESRVSTFIGLGEEPAARKFLETLDWAIQAVRR